MLLINQPEWFSFEISIGTSADSFFSAICSIGSHSLKIIQLQRMKYKFWYFYKINNLK